MNKTTEVLLLQTANDVPRIQIQRVVDTFTTLSSDNYPYIIEKTNLAYVCQKCFVGRAYIPRIQVEKEFKKRTKEEIDNLIAERHKQHSNEIKGLINDL
jgi:hypothetical protein